MNVITKPEKTLHPYLLGPLAKAFLFVSIAFTENLVFCPSCVTIKYYIYSLSNSKLVSFLLKISLFVK